MGGICLVTCHCINQVGCSVILMFTSKCRFNMLSYTGILEESTSKHQLVMSKGSQTQGKPASSIIWHVIKLSYAAFYDEYVHEEKVASCNRCAINHPSQRQHTCVMMVNEEAWEYYHEEAQMKIDLSTVRKTIESVCSDLGFTLAEQTWECFHDVLPKHSWESFDQTSLELERCGQDIKDRVLNTFTRDA